MKHKDRTELWRAYAELAELAAYTDADHREKMVPAINVLLSCLRDAGENCGSDLPENPA